MSTILAFRPIIVTVSTDADAPAFERHGEPVAVGVSCPRGAVARSARWAVTDQRGRSIPVQTTVLDRWGDGTARWLLAEWQADVDVEVPSFYALAPDAADGDSGQALTIEHAGESLRVWTGVATIDVPRTGAGFITAADVGSRPVLESSAIVAEDAHGTRYQFGIQRATVERSGALRAVIRLDGALAGASGQRWLDATVRLHFFAGLGTAKIELSVTNPRAARHPGGVWDLGDPGSVLIRELSIRIVPARGGPADVWGSIDRGDHMEPAGERFAVHQESSGGPHWDHENHVTRDQRQAARYRGFRATRDGREVEGLRATPIASIGGGDSRVSVALPYFWEVWPKALTADATACEVAMFPRDCGDLHELQGGERTTLSMAVCFGRDTVTAEPLAWVRSPLRVTVDPLAHRQAGAWAPMAAGSAAAAEGYDALVSTVVSGPGSFVERRETIDEYGWRNFGDLYADHEGALVSHYNNQYDAVAGFITRFLQTADPRWWTLADQLAAHVADIDLYHTTRDRAAYNGGYFWHTQHYQAAGTATHRAYSRRSGSSGGGPCSEHNYTTGLMLHHFLTGSERSRAAVLQLANWVLDMDDGRKSRFRWIDRRDTGLASVTRSPDFHGPGRGAGNSINALLDAHRLTNEPRYLEKAEALIERCVHPDDDPDALHLLDAENRWSYTVFLQAIGKYLEHRAERGLVDAKYEYARAVLRTYALWMCANERPYLDTPEKLEFPTETWAAQDIRKAAVFEYAARLSTEEGARACFLARADGFVEYTIDALTASPTGRLTRPLVLLLAYGFQRPLSEQSAPPPHASAGSFKRETFTPLRQRLATRLAWAGAGFSAAALVVLVLLIS
jgi:YetA-like protein